ncbi:hypothetical protein BGZ97_012925 [Linnemannia gamsii]|uniref:Uncharacterized protein n=1 Tax=Linnemannia gamsii TaxID=64522 RepID=A0A9P6R0I4_9FUNG|nr:hypothetical protein BGZ97_012925 [Linnemannia gamsii]
MVFQEIYQWTPIQTALGFLVHALFSVLIFPIIGQILPRLPLKPLILTGFLLRIWGFNSGPRLGSQF